MPFRWRRVGTVLALALLCVVAGTAQAPRLAPTVVLISLDGFRWDYPMRAPTPNLDALAARGVRAENLIPVFPSETFPNHYSIVTGLYADHHGIVANSIRDPSTGRAFSLSRREEVRDPLWWGGDPIWTIAERAGQKTAPYFWPGSEAPHGGVRATYEVPYDASVPAAARIERVLGWLDRPAAERPTFVTLYFADTDGAGHASGPDSPQVREAIGRDDRYLGQLVAGLRRRGLLDQVNLVVVSDHGMAETVPARVIPLATVLRDADVTAITGLSPVLGVFPRPGREDAVFQALAAASHLTVYRREATPAHWHYRDHPRVPPIVGVADEGWDIVRGTRSDDTGPGGAHGYDPRLMSMRGIFVAAGPAFRQGVRVPPFENVSLYNVFGRILGLSVPPNDGDPAVVKALLK